MRTFAATLVSFCFLAGCAKSTTQNSQSLPKSIPTQASSATPTNDKHAKEQGIQSGSFAALSAELLSAGATAPSSEGAQSAPETSQGWVHLVPNFTDPHFVPGGSSIAAKLGTSFGIEVILHGPPKMTVVQLRTRVTHPPMTNSASGVTNTVDEWDNPTNVGIPRYIGWSFDNSWELVSGVWVIELLDHQRSILEHEFTITISPSATARPEDASDVQLPGR